MNENVIVSLSFEIEKDLYEQLQLEESSSDISDLTDIFEEFHRSSFLRANAHPSKKYLTKTEADWKTRDSFSDEFKKVIEETRKELEINGSMLFDDKEAIESILKCKLIPDDLLQAKLNECEGPIKIEKENSRRNSDESTTWKILKAYCRKTAFEISPPVYNCFSRQGTNHWMQRPDIPWRRVDESRLKCETWLTNT